MNKRYRIWTPGAKPADFARRTDADRAAKALADEKQKPVGVYRDLVLVATIKPSVRP